MPTDFRASQIQTNKIIASGSTGTTSNALLLIYPISKQSGSNQGFIDTGTFGLSGIGTDVFLFVSGAKGTRETGGTNATSVFGGDLHVSGNLSLSSGSYPAIRTVSLETIANGSTLANAEDNWLIIKASDVTASGSGGQLVLSGGRGGYTSAENGTGHGGDIVLIGGPAGQAVGPGDPAISEGGSVNIFGGAGEHGISTQSRSSGNGGGFLVSTGIGGSSSLAAGSNFGGTGGTIVLLTGQGGDVKVSGSFSEGGQGGSLVVQLGRGGDTLAGIAGAGADIAIYAGDGGQAYGPGLAGIGGNIQIQAGSSGLSASYNQLQSGYVKIIGGRNREVDLQVSGSYLQLGDVPSAGTRYGFSRIFLNQDAGLGSTDFPGYDIFFYVSGTITTGSNDRLSVFGGSVVVSGALRVGNNSSNYISQSGGNMVFFDTAVSGATLAKMTRTFIPVGSYTSTNQLVGNPQVAGQTVVSQSEVGTSEIRLRNVVSTTNATATATVKLYNITSGSYVEIGGAGTTTLSTTSTTPVQLQSVNLISAVNFGTGSNIYEVQVYTSNATYQAVLGSSMFVCV